LSIYYHGIKITKIGYYFSKIVARGVSWPLGPTGKTSLVLCKEKVGQPRIKLWDG
jgi:hypothetical protein